MSDPIEEALHRLVVVKRERYLRRAVERGIINDDQREALTMLYLEELDAAILGWEATDE